jgi:glycosyltransferase involved in cell wall biosynthesis
MMNLAISSQLSSFEHQFCAISHGGATADAIAAAGGFVTKLECRSSIPSLSALNGLVRVIRELRPSVIHCHGAEANFHGVLAGRLCAVPVCIAEEIGFPGHSSTARVVFRWLYRLADTVVAVSEAVKQRIIEFGEVTPDRCDVLPIPVQMIAERRVSTTLKHFEIGFVGRLEAVKNPTGLVRAVSILRDRGLSVRLTIVGDGSQRTSLRSEVEALNLLDCVDLVGYDPAPFARLQRISLYVQPSLSEGFGIALVEAMSMGVPVLATATGGAPEFIADGENGWLLPGTTPEEIADKIMTIASLDPDKLELIAKKGQKSVIDRFSPAAYFTECDALYTGLLARRKKRVLPSVPI